MKKLLIAVCFCCIPMTSIADEEGNVKAWFDPRPEEGRMANWDYGEEAMIIGEHLKGSIDSDQEYPVAWELCLESEASKDRICFKPDSETISSWNSNGIYFTLPDNIYPRGSVILRYQREINDCTNKAKGGYRNIICIGKKLDWDKDDEYIVGSYELYPVIDTVLDDEGNVTNGINLNETYEIRGKWFSTSKSGGIYIDGKRVYTTDIIKWIPTVITFKPTNIGGRKVQVSNGVKQSEVFVAKSQVTVSTSDDQIDAEETTDSVFADVENSHAYYSAIIWGKRSGVLQGYPDGTFQPDKPVNRAEFLKIILETDNSVDTAAVQDPAGFPDVDEDSWYAPYIRYAKANDIVDGYPDGTYKPEKTVNFAEALKIAYSTLGVTTEPMEGKWYARYLAHANYNNVLFTNAVDVGSNMTRKDVVWIVWRLLNQ